MNITLLDVVDNKLKSEILYEERTNLGLNSKVKKKFGDEDAIDNVAYIKFEDPEVERICHEHGVYTYEDAAKVTKISWWFVEKETIKSFNEFRWFTGIKTIEYQAFSYCTALQSVIIPSSVTSIEYGAFEYCRSLQSVTIPENVTTIRNSAFIGCFLLQEINIPDNVISIGRWAFSRCNHLQKINIPDSVVSIENNVFYECDLLKKIIMSKRCPVYDQIKDEYPDIQLIEPKVNEASNLGLNSKVKNKFEKRSENKETNVSEVSEELIRGLYDTWGHVPVEWQASHFSLMRSLSNYGKNEKDIETIGKSFAKFIFDITDGEITFRYNGSWGQENLDAIEFWRTKDKPKVLKNRIYGEQLYWDEMRDRFYKREENFITDWFIPATVEVTKLCPEIRHYFFEKIV